MTIAIFERKVRSGRGAKRAVTKAQQANIDVTGVQRSRTIVNLWVSICWRPLARFQSGRHKNTIATPFRQTHPGTMTTILTAAFRHPIKLAPSDIDMMVT